MFQLRSRRQLQLGATKATPLKAVGTVPTLTSREAGHVGPHRSRTCEACLSGVADHETARCPTCTAPSNGRMRSLTTLPGTKVAARPTTDVRDGRKLAKKTGVALLTRHRGHCEPLWAVIPPLQVVLSSACSVASLGRFPSHYLPGRPHLRKGVLADHLFGWGTPSTRQAGHVTVHSASSVKSPCGAQGGMTLPNKKDTRRGNCGRFGKELIFACPRWPFVRTCPDLSGLVRTCPDLSGLVRTYGRLPVGGQPHAHAWRRAPTCFGSFAPGMARFSMPGRREGSFASVVTRCHASAHRHAQTCWPSVKKVRRRARRRPFGEARAEWAHMCDTSTEARHPADTQQTPIRHPADTTYRTNPPARISP